MKYRIVRRDDVISAFARLGKHVVTFLGFGELGYQEPRRVEEVLVSELARLDPRNDLVNTGTLLRDQGQDGIAAVYAVAKAAGFTTTGVHPSVALSHRQTHRVSPHEDVSFFVRDETWGGLLPGGEQPSPTLETLLAITDACVVVGGGHHAAQELEAFLGSDTPVRYHEADMNHEFSATWASSTGARLDGFEGRTLSVWERRRRSAAGEPPPALRREGGQSR